MNRRRPLRTDPAKARAWDDRSRAKRAARRSERPRTKLTHRPKRVAASVAKVARQLAFEWGEAARRSPCAACGSTDQLHGHHVVEKQTLKRRCRDLGYDALQTLAVLWDRRNLLTLCERCHGRHHAGLSRLARELVTRRCPRVEAFADELNLGWWLDRTYGEAGI